MSRAAYKREWYKKNSEVAKQYVKNYARLHPDKIREFKDRELLRVLDWRIAAMKILGGKCVRCNFSDPRALQFDHIYGGGSKERREKPLNKMSLYRGLYKGTITDYQLLCANCNWIKRYENKEGVTNVISIAIGRINEAWLQLGLHLLLLLPLPKVLRRRQLSLP